MTHRRRRHRLRSATLAAALVATPLQCPTGEIAKRFREAWAPGFAEGLAQAVSEPGAGEAGARRALAALFEGLGALFDVQPEDDSRSSSRQ